MTAIAECGRAEAEGKGVEREERGVRGARLTVRMAARGVPPSARLVELCLRFGVPMTGPGAEVVCDAPDGCPPGSITLIAGPSGSGKSLLLAEIARRLPAARMVNDLPFPTDVAVIDAVAPTRPIGEALELLSACGVGEPRLWMRRFDELSDGERFRARLARAIGVAEHDRRHDGSAAVLLCDEFGSFLHARLAKAVSFNLRKLVSRHGLGLILASSREEIVADLRPDRLIILPTEPASAASPYFQPRSDESAALQFSLFSQLRFEQGTLQDYRRFAFMHYRCGEGLGFVDKVFVCREGAAGAILGVVVYGRPALELALRNQVMNRRYVRRPGQLNRELRVLKRLIVHPDVRGCGVGHWLVRHTLPLAETPFVECLAAMGAVNPVFEKAGMRRIGVCAGGPVCDQVLAELHGMGADPFSADFAEQVCRRLTVRRLVAQAAVAWYRGITGDGEHRVSRQTPTLLAQTFRQLAGSRPVYYLWARDPQGWESISRGLDAADGVMR